MRVTKAQPIKSYKAPQYLVEPQGPAVGEEALAIINGQYLPAHLEGKVSWQIIESTVRGWNGYNAIIRLHIGELEWDYLARIEKEGDVESLRWSGDIHELQEQAWEGFVGSQTPEEFIELASEGNIEDMIANYVAALPEMFGDYDEPVVVVTDWGAEIMIDELLIGYLERHAQEEVPA